MAVAHPNIALVKYWGKRPGPGNLPAVGSLSITLDTLRTDTTVSPDAALQADVVSLNGRPASPADAARISAFLRDLRGAHAPFARVDSANNFPTGAGLASSASGFAALTVAAARAYGRDLNATQLSAWARRGSGSAARSIFGGFVQMHRGTHALGDDCVAEPLVSAASWPLRVVVAITSEAKKNVLSTAGMERTRETAPYWQAWVDTSEADLVAARTAVMARDFAALADVAEHSCMKMHALAMAARPPLLYWKGATVDGVRAVVELRQRGVPVFYTIDAGPQLKAVCLPEAEDIVVAALEAVPGVQRVLRAGLGQGARVVSAP